MNDSEYCKAYAGAVILAEYLYELRLIRIALTGSKK